MRVLMILPLAIGLAGCAEMSRAPAWPDHVTLHGTQMRVSFSDGTVCRAQIADAPSGDLQGCRWPMHYDVSGYRPSYLAGVPGIGQWFQSYAKIELSAPSGQRWRFETPDPAPTNARGDG
jgi:hypothetical protein